MFVKGPKESLDAMFARFDGIISNLRSIGVLRYSNHERAIKLLYVHDRSIWKVKISSIEESSSYDILICDELFSKFKSTEIAKMAQISLENPYLRTWHWFSNLVVVTSLKLVFFVLTLYLVNLLCLP